MRRKDRTSSRESGVPPGDEVVRLPVQEGGLAHQLDEMPAPKRRMRLQPTVAVDLSEEELEEPIVHTPADLVMHWEDEESKRRQTPVGWLVLIGVVLMGLGGWALAKLSKGEANLGERARVIDEGWAEKERRREAAMEFLDRVEVLARAYLLADDIEEKSKYVRQPERVIPLMEAYYARHNFEPARYERITNIGPIGIEQRPFVLVQVEVEGGEKRMLFMEEQLDGELKFDWEAEVCYQPMDLDQYIEQKPTEAMDFRVYARWDKKKFYGFEFSDPERYRVLLLSAPNTEEFLFAYVERGSEAEEEIVEYLKRIEPGANWESLTEDEKRRFKRGMPLMLRLRFLPETRGRRSVLVEKMVAPRWVYVEPPEEEKAIPEGRNP